MFGGDLCWYIIRENCNNWAEGQISLQVEMGCCFTNHCLVHLFVHWDSVKQDESECPLIYPPVGVFLPAVDCYLLSERGAVRCSDWLR